MEKLSEVKNIKKESSESVLSKERNVPNEKQMDMVKEETGCLVQSNIYIKTEPKEDMFDESVNEGTSNGIETDEPKVKIEADDELIDDPLDVNSKVKENEELNKKNTCNKAFKSKRKSAFTCEICMQSFKQKDNLTNHMKTHNGEKPYFCKICKKGLSQKSNLKYHIMIHSDKKPFLCDVCNISFALKHDLSRHKRIHTGVRPYVCYICEKAFRTKSDHNSHRLLHTGEKPFACDICGKSFARKAYLNSHKRTHEK